MTRTPYVVRCTSSVPLYEGRTLNDGQGIRLSKGPVSAKEQPDAASGAGLSCNAGGGRAVRLADREGADGLSMRRLAGELGAGAMSLYHYVANKDELLDAMIDVVFDQIELPSGDTDWMSAMRQRAVSAREVLARHPWAIGLMDSRTSPGPGAPAPPRGVHRLFAQGGLLSRHGDPRRLVARRLRLRLRSAGGQVCRSTAPTSSAT